MIFVTLGGGKDFFDRMQKPITIKEKVLYWEFIKKKYIYIYIHVCIYIFIKNVTKKWKDKSQTRKKYSWYIYMTKALYQNMKRKTQQINNWQMTRPGTSLKIAKWPRDIWKGAHYHFSSEKFKFTVKYQYTSTRILKKT